MNRHEAAFVRDEPRKPGPRGPGKLPRGTAQEAGRVELRTTMSIGRRRPKLSRAHLRPAESISLKETRVARQRARAALLLAGGRRRRGDRDDRARSGPAVHVSDGRAARARAEGQRHGVQAPQSDQDQQRAPGRRRPGCARDGQRSRADSRAGREARRPDDGRCSLERDSKIFARASARAGSSSPRATST